MTQHVSGSRGWATIANPKSVGSAAGDLLPGRRAVVGAVDAVVVALVERLGLAGGHRELVDALAGLGEVGPSGLNSARTPTLRASHDVAAVARLEDADGRDPDPRPVRVGRVGDDRVEDEPAGARPPGRPASGGWSGPRRGVQVAPPSSLRKRPAGSTPASSAPSGRRRERPDRLDRLGRRRRRSARPTNGVQVVAAVVAPPDRRAVPGVARRRPGSRRVPGSTIMSWTGQPSHSGPLIDQSRRVRVAVEDERALLGPDEQPDSLVMTDLPSIVGFTSGRSGGRHRDLSHRP